MTDIGSIASIIGALEALAALLLLLWIIYGPWQAVLTDYARQILFEARDEVFDLARNGKLDFNSSEYRTIRLSLEKSIRFAHELTWPRFLLLAVEMDRRGHLGRKSDLRSAIEKIEDYDTRERVSRIVGNAHQYLVASMALKSPVILVVAGCFALILGMRAARSHRLTGGIGEIIQREAESASTPPEYQPA